MTIILQPKEMHPDSLPLLSMVTSLAIAEVISSFAPALDLLIKWPNDIYAGQKKLAGILIENSMTSSRVQHCLIGIGMNINESSFPDDLSNATSLHLLTGNKYDVSQVAHAIHQQVMSFINNDFDKNLTWKERYDERIFGKGTRHTFLQNGETIAATVNGVDISGKILLNDAGGNRKGYFSHEIQWVL
jgi:BirA family biotin operon repressor/biotin-[acetyl-CoA-carboxylase] ligase